MGAGVPTLRAFRATGEEDMGKLKWVAAVFLFSCAVAHAAAPCATGAYAGGDADERVAVAGPFEVGGPQRYVFLDGRRGRVDDADGPLRCQGDTLEVRAAAGGWTPWPRLAWRQTPARFESHGTRLNGLLIEAPEAGPTTPLVVMVHGSERTPAVGSTLPYVMAMQGLSVFVYDKRGTGKSEGFYTQNFDLLAEDAAAAVREARRLLPGPRGRVGLLGGSQGGWVAPLAAQRSGADFVAVGFGLVLSPLEEDEQQVLDELRRAGFGEREQALAREVTTATGRVIASHFTRGFDALEQVKRRFAGEPWFRHVQGEFSGDLLKTPTAELRRHGPALFDNLQIEWNHDAVGQLRSLKAPLLWVLAGADREAPIGLTQSRLLALPRTGPPVEVYRFPDTDHGMVEFVEAADGSRRYTRVTEGYFRLVGDWIKGGAAGRYGRAERLR
jgi:pimeloyl-ACP methyl ester carboxylesterase